MGEKSRCGIQDHRLLLCYRYLCQVCAFPGLYLEDKFNSVIFTLIFFNYFTAFTFSPLNFLKLKRTSGSSQAVASAKLQVPGTGRSLVASVTINTI